MHKVTKLAGISLLALSLTACDGDAPASKTPVDNATTSVPAGQQVSLLDGKLAFTLPNGMADQSGKLSNQANNMHVYADSTGQRAVIVIIEDDDVSDDLTTLAQRLEDQQRSRDANLQMVTSKAIGVNSIPLWQLDTIITSGGQKAYSSVILGALNGKQLTLQITLPADNPQQAQSEAESILSTLKLKQ